MYGEIKTNCPHITELVTYSWHYSDDVMAKFLFKTSPFLGSKKQKCFQIYSVYHKYLYGIDVQSLPVGLTKGKQC